METNGLTGALPAEQGGVPAVMQSVVAQATAAAEGNAEDERQRRDGHRVEFGELSPHDTAIDDPPPAYGDEYYQVVKDDPNLGVDTKVQIREDGRVNISINQKSGRLSTILAPMLADQLSSSTAEQEPLPPPYIPLSLGGEPVQDPPPPMNVVIHVVGSRGDVQPFVALGKVLKDTYGHRVRLATHPIFQQFVTENGLEFFSIGGDPAQLMAFMVKNPGLMPGFDTLRSGDVGKRRKEISEMIKGCWRSCIETGDGTGVEAPEEIVEARKDSTSSSNRPLGLRDGSHRPFIADAIIANPPSFAHIHCAEKLGCPLHIMFTMPYSPTQAFPHPLANIQSSNADPSITNFLSYGMVDILTWQGLGDIVNRFRANTLGLDPVSLMWAPGMLNRLRIPHTYCWSPALIPKPKDWKRHISISGFYFLSLASTYTPPPELEAFLKAGPPPLYIGFGSIVVDDPNAMTRMIFDAIRKTGQRALVSKGWGGIGADDIGIPEGVMMLGNVPHDWLFQRVSAVVHHGGAGTTAAGIAAGKPTVIVPFFGDQPFWGAMVAKAGAGPVPIAYKDLDADKLAESIKTALLPATSERARELSASIAEEDGCQTGAQSFHQQVEVDKLRCSLSPSRVAVWRLKRTNVRLSALAATVLGNEGLLDFKNLKLFRAKEHELDTGPTDPVSGGATAIIGTASSIMMGMADLPVETLKALHIHPSTTKKDKGKAKDTASPSRTADDRQTMTPRSSEQTPSTSVENVSWSDARTSDAASLRSQESLISPPSTNTVHSQFNVEESLAQLGPSSATSPTGETEAKGASMRMALRDQLSSEFIRRTSGQSSQRTESPRRSQSPSCPRKSEESPARPVDTVVGTGKGVGRILDASLRSPMDFTHSLAKGFHNAPRLYGDSTVRKSDKITGFKSGAKAAGKEFGYGFYDGITGMITQPVSGAKKEGTAGFFKGLGKGIGGLVLKPGAAMFGLPGYMMKGVYKELQGVWGANVNTYAIAARTAQGFEDWHKSTHEERTDIVQRWAVLTETIKEKKNVDELLLQWGHEQKTKALHCREDRRRLIKDHLNSTDFRGVVRKPVPVSESINARDPKASIDGSDPSTCRNSFNRLRKMTTSPAPNRAPAHPETPSDVDVLTPASSFEEEPPAHLQYAATFPRPAAVHHSSSGTTTTQSATHPPRPDSARQPTVHDPHAEDEELELAIQRSLAQARTGDAHEDELLERAIRESVRQLEERDIDSERRGGDHDDGNDEEAKAIEAALQASLSEVRRAVVKHESKRVPVGRGQGQPRDDVRAADEAEGEERDGEKEQEERRLADAIRQSLQDHDAREKERSEEEIVLEYVKKQSLVEEEHRKKRDLLGGGGGGWRPGSGGGVGEGASGGPTSAAS